MSESEQRRGAGKHVQRDKFSCLITSHRFMNPLSHTVALLGAQLPYLGVNVMSKVARSPSFTVATANGGSTNSASLPSPVRTLTVPLFRSTFLTTPVMD